MLFVADTAAGVFAEGPDDPPPPPEFLRCGGTYFGALISVSLARKIGTKRVVQKGRTSVHRSKRETLDVVCRQKAICEY